MDASFARPKGRLYLLLNLALALLEQRASALSKQADGKTLARISKMIVAMYDELELTVSILLLCFRIEYDVSSLQLCRKSASSCGRGSLLPRDLELSGIRLRGLSV